MNPGKRELVSKETRLARTDLKAEAAFWNEKDLTSFQERFRTVGARFAENLHPVRVQRSGPRSWPPKPHRDPVAFNAGQEATGILKSITVTLLPHYQKILDQRDRVWTCDHVREFDLSFYVPLDILDRRKARIDNVVIMLNGLNEISHLHYNHYDRIGARLASRGIAAILYPTPFHLNRAAYLEPCYRVEYERHDRQKVGDKRRSHLQRWSEDADTVSTRLPHHSLLNDPEGMFYCFEQTANELRALGNCLTASSADVPTDLTTLEAAKPFFDRLFLRRPNTRVSLLGYSLGGLQALYAFLLKPELFHRCILMNSGAHLDKMKTKPAHITDEEWGAIRKGVAKVRFDHRQDIAHTGVLDDVLFNRPFHDPQVKELFPKYVRKILFVSGGADIVSPVEQLQFLEPEQAPRPDEGSFGGLNILQIAGLEHALQHSPVYDEWFLALMRIIEQFVRAPSAETPVHYNRLIQDLALIRIGDKSWAAHVRKHDGRTPDDAFVNPDDQSLDLRRLLPLLSAKDQSKFLDYYYISKRFFDDDSDMVRAVERSQRDVRTVNAEPRGAAAQRRDQSFEG